MNPSTPIRATARTWPAAAARSVARRAVVVLGAALALGACEGDELTNEPIPDATKPTVKLAKAPGQSDTTLVMSVNATDNLGLKTIQVRLSGGVAAAYDTTFNSAVTAANLALTVQVPASAVIGSTVNIRAIAIDGNSNASDTAYLAMTVGNLEPPQVVITSPKSGAAVVSGKSLVLSISAKARYKVKMIGFVTTGAYNARDSVTYGAQLKDSTATLDTLALPDTIRGATLTVTPFIVDSLNQRAQGTPVAYSVQSAANSNTIPLVTLGVNNRLEVTDTLFVEASDAVGISSVGYEIRNLAGALIASDSASSTGSLTTLIRTFKTRLPITVFPTSVRVTAFARNANGRRDVNRHPSGVERIDTVAVVAGFTNPLPNGGVVADAIYFPRNDRLYLTNIERNQVEVFNLADSAFKAPINVGSRPWGISAWPRNRDGTMGDTLLVANSGGTNISYVNLNSGPTGREVFRYALPNLIVYSITTVKSATTDAPMQQRTVYDFSDRPQYLASTCQSAATTTAPCGDVILVYSTTPTPGQTTPFANKGTVRWENLIKKTSHFFFEHALGQSQARSDTLEIERFAAAGFGSDSILLPFKNTIQTPNGPLTYSTVGRIDQLAFRDTTYVRNSGDFRRAVIGEGGPVLGSRALTYDATMGFDLTPNLPIIDKGVSRPLDVTDFIANTFARVQGVGINFDGELAAVKGDSTYIFDRTLRLQGLLQSKSSGGGLDFHPQNRGLNSTPLRTRLAFVASSDAVIDIFDTWCYQKVASVAIRDPIIGPVRASARPNGQLVLVGATIRGVTLVALPDTFTTTCQ